MPIFPYLTGLSKLNALAGIAGSDTVILHILGEIISGLFSQSLFSPHYINLKKKVKPTTLVSFYFMGDMQTPL